MARSHRKSASPLPLLPSARCLKGESFTQGYSYDDVLALASGARGEDPFGYRAEFLNLVRLAKLALP